MVTKNFLLKWILLFLLGVFLVIIFVFYSSDVVGVEEIPVDYNVGSHLGIDLTPDGVHFGTIQKGFSFNHGISLNASEDVLVNIYVIDIENVYVEDDNFLLRAGESRDIAVVLRLPDNLEEGYYSGRLRVVYRKPKSI